MFSIPVWLRISGRYTEIMEWLAEAGIDWNAGETCDTGAGTKMEFRFRDDKDAVAAKLRWD